MRLLLDTNVCIHLLNGTRPSYRSRVESAGPGALHVSALTVAELMFGAERSSRVEANRRRIETFLHEIPAIEFSLGCADLFGQLKAGQMRAGAPMDDFDLAIAATAVSSGMTLVSEDGAFRRVPGLLLESWTSAR